MFLYWIFFLSLRSSTSFSLLNFFCPSAAFFGLWYQTRINNTKWSPKRGIRVNSFKAGQRELSLNRTGMLSRCYLLDTCAITSCSCREHCEMDAYIQIGLTSRKCYAIASDLIGCRPGLWHRRNTRVFLLLFFFSLSFLFPYILFLVVVFFLVLLVRLNLIAFLDFFFLLLLRRQHETRISHTRKQTRKQQKSKWMITKKKKEQKKIWLNEAEWCRFFFGFNVINACGMTWPSEC